MSWLDDAVPRSLAAHQREYGPEWDTSPRDLALITHLRQQLVDHHRIGLHDARVRGCPYCYAPGMDGLYGAAG